jgi:uncharacterized protein YdeI (YjbR/CyaY-like superfamily)
MNKENLNPVFFANKLELRKWFEINHLLKEELILGYYKQGTGKPSIDWPQSVDEALCFGWIDGIRRSIDEERYCIRFTPRKPNSHWSDVNIKKVAVLKAKGLMKQEGIDAFEKMDKSKSRSASYEKKKLNLNKEYEKKFKMNNKAWKYFSEKLAPSARKLSIHWIMSAKKEETQIKRLLLLIECSEREEKIPLLRVVKK